MQVKINNIEYDLFEIVHHLFSRLGITYTNYMLIDGQSILSEALRVYSNKEPIDEEELDKLAKMYPLDISGGEVSKHVEYLIDKAFKAGYKRAMGG